MSASRRLHAEALPIPGLQRVRRTTLADERGRFARLFCADELGAAGWPGALAQVNLSSTARRGTVRGLHFQCAPHAEAKLVSCIRGRVFDVALDLRPGSPTFGRWHGETLDAARGDALLIPPGCAHGFQTLDDEVELVYCHSALHVAAAEGGVHPLDAALAIAWPLPVALLSPRDQALPGWAEVAGRLEGVR